MNCSYFIGLATTILIIKIVFLKANQRPAFKKTILVLPPAKARGTPKTV
jgi:membrane protein CcdC involved in cytochrome C biogenesis